MAELKYVDLFAGCGGLSLGVERAGFELVAAVEKSSMPAQTFYHNFVDNSITDEDWLEYLDKPIEEQLNHKVIPRAVSEVLENDEVMESIRKQGIDLVCGGPPCQGFSTAGRRDHADPRNQLAWQFLEFVEKTSPKVVVIENVLGMNRSFPGESKTPFQMYSEALAETGEGYLVQKAVVNAMHYGAPQSRPRVLIIGVREDVAKNKSLNTVADIWKSDFSDISSVPANVPVPVPSVSSSGIRTVADAITDLQDAVKLKATNKSNSDVFLADIKDHAVWNLKEENPVPNMNVPKHTPVSIYRMRLKQALDSHGIHKDLLYRFSCGDDVSGLLQNIAYPLSSPDGQLVIQDEKELREALVIAKSKKRSQVVLDPDAPSKTVVTIPEDYIHPVEPRIFTVREMARFQAFPDSFVFRGRIATGGAMRKTTVPQYSQVGNAVSPALSKAIGKMAHGIISGEEK